MFAAADEFGLRSASATPRPSHRLEERASRPGMRSQRRRRPAYTPSEETGWSVVRSSSTPVWPASWRRAPRRRSRRPRPKSSGGCASSFPKSLDTIFGGADTISKRVAASTNNKFQIQMFAAGEIVPGVRRRRCRAERRRSSAAHTAPYYFFGKDPTFAFGCAIPFGMNARQQNAWMYHGGGMAADARVLQGLQHHQLPGRQHRRADGRLVPQGDQDRRRPARA